jgi:succinate-semialdehyde dehydrogenase
MTQVSSLTHAISINPATGEQIGHYPFESAPVLDAALCRCRVSRLAQQTG